MEADLRGIEQSLRALLDSLRNAHLAIASGRGHSAMEYVAESDSAANKLQSLLEGKPEDRQAVAQLFIDVLAGHVRALRTLLREVESKRAAPEEITAFSLRPLPPVAWP